MYRMDEVRGKRRGLAAPGEEPQCPHVQKDDTAATATKKVRRFTRLSRAGRKVVESTVRPRIHCVDSLAPEPRERGN